MISLLPMVIEKPSLGGTYYYSMALVIMGGLLLSTILTLILLPTATTLVEDGTNALARLMLRFAILLRLKKRQEALAD
jgi:Cu/Ag efflux pump CusA